jgi:hypothetical protein
VTTTHVLATTEGTLSIGTLVTLIAVEAKINATTSLVQYLSPASPRRLMHAGWYGAQVSGGTASGLAQAYWRYLEFEHQYNNLTGQGFAIDSLRWHLAPGVSVDLYVYT